MSDSGQACDIVRRMRSAPMACLGARLAVTSHAAQVLSTMAFGQENVNCGARRL